jgi:acetyl esterase/lipase
MMRACILSFLLLWAVPLSASPLSYEHFGNLPDVSGMQLSPSGKKISSVIRIDVDQTKGMAVEVADLETKEKKMVLFTDNQKYIINWIRWKDDRTLLVGVFYPSRRDTWLGSGQARFKTRDTRMMIVDTESGKVSTPFSKAFLKKYRILPSAMDQIVDLLPDDPDHILMAFPTNETLRDGRLGKGLSGVFKVNIHNQRTQRIHDSMDFVVSWMTDQQSRIRVGFYYHFMEGTRKFLVLSLADGKWLELWPHTLFAEDSVEVLGFGLDPNQLYIRAYHEDRLAIFKVNLADKSLPRELVLADPNYDISGSLVYSPLTRDVVGITHAQEGGFTFFDAENQQLQAAVNRALPTTKNFIVSVSGDAQKYVVLANSDVDSGTFYLGQRSPAKLDALAYRYKSLVPDLMASVKRYDYQARDGLKIEGYLALPKDRPAKNLPTIIFPHGGPISRSTDSFDPWTQFFVNKGYAVLQMNFRGSSGQGLAFRNAGLQNWGQEMQDDVQDGALKMIADGIADPKSICIVGASYGGYAALMGAVKTPDFYRCAVSIAGVSNVLELVRDNRIASSRYNVVDEQVGNDANHLRSISPVNHAAKIQVPVLLIHGDSDRQVDIKHSQQMRDALTKASKDVTYLELANEDHFLTNNDNRVATFRAVDAFLDKHLLVAP